MHATDRPPACFYAADLTTHNRKIRRSEYIDKYLSGDRLKTVLGLTFRAYEDEGISIADLKTDPLLEDEIVRLAFSGTDAPAGQVAEAVKFVARHPQWFQRLVQEQAAIVAKHGPDFTQEVRGA